MKIKKVGDVTMNYFYSGRVQSDKKLELKDFVELAKASWAYLMRQKFYELKKMDEGDEYYLFSPILSTVTIPLTAGRRPDYKIADMSGLDLYRLPKNSHIANIYPVACNGKEQPKSITQVQPGEENFYLAPEFSFFEFAVLKGRSLHLYHLPACAKEVDVEASFDSNDIDVPLDMAYEIINTVLGISLQVKGFPIKGNINPYDPDAREIKRMLEQDKPLNA